MQYSAKDSELHVYKNVTPKEVQFSTVQQPAGDDNVKMKNNPSYFAVGHSISQVAEDHVNTEENIYQNVQ